MEDTRSRNDALLFDKVISATGKHVTAVYSRRHKDAGPRRLLQDTLKNDVRELLPAVSRHKHKKSQRGAGKVEQNRQSWMDRSLSLRRRRSSIVHPLDDGCPENRGNARGKADVPCGGAHMQRRKKAEAPIEFVQEQRAMFAEIDAFELEEAVPSPIHVTGWKDENSDAAAVDIVLPFHARHAPLEAVPEDALGEISHQTPASYVLSGTRHMLAAALTTPHGRHWGDVQDFTACQKEVQTLVELFPRSIRVTDSEEEQRISAAEPCGTAACSLVEPLYGDVTGSSTCRSKGSRIGHKLTASLSAPSPELPDLFPTAELCLAQYRGALMQESEHNGSHKCSSLRAPTGSPVQGQTTLLNVCKTAYLTHDHSSDKQGPPSVQDLEGGELVGRKGLSFSHSRTPFGLTAEIEESTFQELATRKVFSTSPSQHLHQVARARTPASGLGVLALDRLSLHDRAEPYSAILEEDEEDVANENITVKGNGNISLVDDDRVSVFYGLLRESGQTRLTTQREAISAYCDMSKITKIGEGTYGEAFKEGDTVLKIVPVDGDFRVNGELQKTSAELYDEVLLSSTLNKLQLPNSSNFCTNFITTKGIKYCRGKYDEDLIRAWEEWDAEHKSENDHPMSFPEQQRYVIFILADGGKDLESFVLADSAEVKSLLVQVVLSLAIAETACEFEHRDLHWGNLVLARTEEHAKDYCLDGNALRTRTCGLSLSIIDFTLSRVNTGRQVLFCNLGADPAIFDGPPRDIQADTYRGMLKITQGHWEGRFSKTNVLWIHYLASIVLNKKSFNSSTKQKRDLRSFRSRVLLYDSARAAVSDDFFQDMWES